MAQKEAIRHVFLSGPPGIGKTTLIQSLVNDLKSRNYQVQGFYTQEVRETSKRIGFDVVTLDGKRGVLSRVGERQGPKVGQYVVDMQSFEHLALPVISPLNSSGHMVIVIDEVGKMELFSQTFIQSVRKLMKNPAVTILGTIPVPKGRPLGLVEEIRRHRNIQVYNLSRYNRDTLQPEVMETILKCMEN